jgi:hypothetical protein
MKKNRLIVLSAALIVGVAVVLSCSKEETEPLAKELILKKANVNANANDKIDVTAVLVVSPNTETICLNTEVTITATAKVTATAAAVTGGKISIEEFIAGEWIKIAGYTDLPGNPTFKFTPTSPGDRTFRAHYVGGSDYSNSDDQKVVTAIACGCVTELKGEAISCGAQREANFTFTYDGELPYVKIQGGLTNFTGADAVVTVPAGYTVSQKTPGGSSNRVITVEGPASCTPLVINIKWNSTNSGGVITGEWTAKDNTGVLLGSVAGLSCP